MQNAEYSQMKWGRKKKKPKSNQNKSAQLWQMHTGSTAFHSSVKQKTAAYVLLNKVITSLLE